VRRTCFTVDKLRVVSASDDRTVRVTDVPSQQSLLSIPHGDRVRAQTPCAAAPHLWLTGCYDGGVRLFDLRVPKAEPVRMIWHARHEQVDDVCFISNESSMLIATAGGPYVRFWDLLQTDGQATHSSGQAMLAETERHRKAVMALTVDAKRHRLLSLSLDGALKVHDLGAMTTLHTMHVGAGCLGMGLSADGCFLAVGQVDGRLHLLQRGARKAAAKAETTPQLETREEEQVFTRFARGHLDRGDPSRPYRPGTRRYFLRGMHLELEPALDDIVLGQTKSSADAGRRQRLKAHDRHLRHFEYKKALQAVMETKQSALIVSMLVELDHRRGLQTALDALSEAELIRLVDFLTKHLPDRRYASILVPVSHLILDLYGDHAMLSAPVRACLQRLVTSVQQQVHHLGELERIAASVELFLT
jgi:U3 small nucleolar RNA-associated protein 15